MDEQKIFEKVKDAISVSCGIDKETITPDSTLFNDLGITSIDLVDIMYTLENDFNITLNVSEIEIESRKEMDGEPFEVDNIITQKGLDVLKRKFPEMPEEKLIHGLTIYEIAYLINVSMLCSMISYKLKQIDEQKNETGN